MDLKRVSGSDLFGRSYLKVPGAKGIEAYFVTIDALRPFLRSGEWQEAATGYYLNAVGDLDTVRVSYFAPRSGDPERLIKELCATGRFIQAREPEPLHEEKVSGPYGGEEEQFRRFLSAYSPIGLDMMEKDLLNARCLMATFRWQVMLSRASIREHFEKTFETQSPSYNLLSSSEKEDFLRDLGQWPDPLQVDWAHMMVNMILPGDWNKEGAWKNFITPQPAKTLPEINDIVRRLGFQIPPGWHPAGRAILS